MSHVLLPTTAFSRAVRRWAKRRPDLIGAIQVALGEMSEDLFSPALRTHKLQGDLTGSWACRAGYDLRIVFTFVEHNGTEAVLLQSIGTHDEVY